MADIVQVPDDLRAKFAEIHQIAEVTGRLVTTIDQINAASKDAAGMSDKIAKAYHAKVDKPTNDLSRLTAGIAQAFGVTAEKGGKIASLFEDADADAHTAAGSW